MASKVNSRGFTIIFMCCSILGVTFTLDCNFQVSSRQTRQTDESMLALCKSPQLRLMMTFLILVYMACAIVFDGLVRMSESLGLDFFITFTLTSATEIPSVTLLAIVLDR